MLHPLLRPIRDYIDKAVDKAGRSADRRQNSANKTQGEIIVAIQSLTDEFKAYQAKQAATERGKNRKENWTIGALFATTIVTVALAVIGVLQWRTLDKTDDTLRAGQRAFVFAKQDITWTAAKKSGDEVIRSLVVIWENNGNSQTKDLKISLWCPRPNIFVTTDPITSGLAPDILNQTRLLGPKQSVWGGVCHYNATELESIKARNLPWFIAARATYYDIFGEKHVTEHCSALLNIDGDFRNVSAVPTTDAIGCPAHNCADEECNSHQE